MLWLGVRSIGCSNDEANSTISRKIFSFGVNFCRIMLRPASTLSSLLIIVYAESALLIKTNCQRNVQSKTSRELFSQDTLLALEESCK